MLISSGPGDLLMLSSFKIDNIVFSVIFNLSISVLLFTVGIVGINPGCSVVKTLENVVRKYICFIFISSCCLGFCVCVICI